MPQQTIGQVSRTNVLAEKSPTFVQPIAFLSKSSSNFNEINQTSSSGDGGYDGADEEKLSIIYEQLREQLPNFFTEKMNFRKVHKDIVFENRIRGKTY